MRFLLNLLIFSSLSTAALAQKAPPPLTAAADSAAAAATAATSKGKPAGSDAGEAKEEIGYDAKVKRAPYGRPLKDDKGAAAAPAPAPELLRTDHHLTGDSTLFKK